MARPCGHDIQLEPGHPYENNTCRICWLYWNNAAYKALWDAATPVPSPEEVKKQIEERKSDGGCGCGKKS